MEQIIYILYVNIHINMDIHTYIHTYVYLIHIYVCMYVCYVWYATPTMYLIFAILYLSSYSSNLKDNFYIPIF